MDFIQTYGKMLFDIGLIGLFLFILFSNLHMTRLIGAIKGVAVVAVLWFTARILGLPMAETTLGYVVQFSFLGLMILFPKDFRTLLENIGRRRAFSWNTQNLIRNDSREHLAKAVVSLARKRHGAIIVIAREDTLDEEALSGEFIGEMAIRQSFIEMLAHPESTTHKGAIIIKDDQIIAAKALLPVAENKSLESVGAGKRHLAGLGVVADKDCVAIVVSGETGAITMIGKLNGSISIDFAQPIKDVDLIDGIDEEFILKRLEDYLRGNDTLKRKPTKKNKKVRTDKSKQVVKSRG